MSRIALKGTLALLLLTAAGAARADAYLESRYRLTNLVGVTWEASIPVGTLRDFVDQPTYRGGQLEVRTGVTRHLSLGLASSWDWITQNFTKKTTQFGDALVTAPTYDRLQLITLRGTLDWYLTDTMVQPYLGAGVGGVWASAIRAVGPTSRSHSEFTLVAEPHLGALITIAPGIAVLANARYQYTLANAFEAKNIRTVVLGVGLAVY